ncbi:P-loop NTPase fold protein [Bernardetia sp. OM2101]|uniref:P-loop NTPase fold protein n=1 Tax=Bernardetia sp. OM2101 TaxID=3344876 RepID=UPI0035CF8622
MKTSEYKTLVLKFLQDEKSDYALMLDGDWGTGKTHFWKQNIVNEILQNDIVIRNKGFRKYIPIHISLNGKSNIEELKKEIFQTKTASMLGISLQKFKLINSLSTSIGKLVKQNLDFEAIAKSIGVEDKDLKEIKNNIEAHKKKGWFKGNFDFLSKKNIDSTTNELSKTKSFLICFDDLERCPLKITQIWGLISKYVEEENNTKVLVIANEKEIGDSKDEKKLYKRVKEKVIGKSLKYELEGSEAIDFIINELDGRLVDSSYGKQIIKKKQELIKQEFGNYGNFRVINSTLSSLFDILEEVVRHNRQKKILSVDSNSFPTSQKVIEQLVTQMIRFSIEHMKETFTHKDISDFIEERGIQPDFSNFASNFDTNKIVKEKTEEDIYKQKIRARIHKNISYDSVLNGILEYVVYSYSINLDNLLNDLLRFEKEEVRPEVLRANESFNSIKSILGISHENLLNHLNITLNSLKEGLYDYKKINRVAFRLINYAITSDEFSMSVEDILDAYKLGLSKQDIDKRIDYYIDYTFLYDEAQMEGIQERKDVIKECAKIFNNWNQEYNYKIEYKEGRELYEHIYINQEIDFNKLIELYEKKKRGLFIYLEEENKLDDFIKRALICNRSTKEFGDLIYALSSYFVKNDSSNHTSGRIREYLYQSEIEIINSISGVICPMAKDCNKKLNITRKLNLEYLCRALKYFDKEVVKNN